MREGDHDAVHGHGISVPIGHDDVAGLVGSVLRRARPAEELLGRFGPGILEDAALVADVERVRVHRVGLLRRHLDGNLVRLAVGDAVGARAQIPLTPGRDDLDLRVERQRRELEAHLVVALAGGAVGDGVAALGLCGLHHRLGDHGTRDRRAQEVVALVDRVGAKHRETEVARELFAQVGDDALLRARRARLLVQAVELLSLTHVSAEGDDRNVVLLLQPGEDHGGVEAAAVGEEDASRLAGAHGPRA